MRRMKISRIDAGSGSEISEKLSAQGYKYLDPVGLFGCFGPFVVRQRGFYSVCRGLCRNRAIPTGVGCIGESHSRIRVRIMPALINGNNEMNVVTVF
jgi:hypothetical protein